MTDITDKQKAEIIFEMLGKFKEDHEFTNTALRETGSSKYVSPFESVQVQDIKEYALSFVANKDWIYF